MRKIIRVTGILVVSLLVITILSMFMLNIKPISFGLHSAVYQSGGSALDGYDVVSYFKGKPIKGDESYSVEWKDVRWIFYSPENRNEFISNPEKFVPQFGGYCTKAVSTGFTAPGDPTVYTVRNDKLFIFSDEDVKETFMNDPETMLTSCSKHWN
jgi:YHS domain-containing protein